MQTQKQYYENLFKDYPDVVNFETMRIMLGGISESYLRPRLQTGKIKCLRKYGKDYLIPKIYVIDFILSDEYQTTKHRLKAQV